MDPGGVRVIIRLAIDGTHMYASYIALLAKWGTARHIAVDVHRAQWWLSAHNENNRQITPNAYNFSSSRTHLPYTMTRLQCGKNTSLTRTTWIGLQANAPNAFPLYADLWLFATLTRHEIKIERNAANNLSNGSATEVWLVVWSATNDYYARV